MAANRTIELPPNELVQDWSILQVCEWIKQIGLEKYDLQFKNHYVDGTTLLNSDIESKLKSMKMAFSDRKKVIECINIYRKYYEDDQPDYDVPASSSEDGDWLDEFDGTSSEDSPSEDYLKQTAIPARTTSLPVQPAALAKARSLTRQTESRRKEEPDHYFILVDNSSNSYSNSCDEDDSQDVYDVVADIPAVSGMGHATPLPAPLPARPPKPKNLKPAPPEEPAEQERKSSIPLQVAPPPPVFTNSKANNSPHNTIGRAKGPRPMEPLPQDACDPGRNIDLTKPVAPITIDAGSMSPTEDYELPVHLNPPSNRTPHITSSNWNQPNPPTDVDANFTEDYVVIESPEAPRKGLKANKLNGFNNKAVTNNEKSVSPGGKTLQKKRFPITPTETSAASSEKPKVALDSDGHTINNPTGVKNLKQMFNQPSNPTSPNLKPSKPISRPNKDLMEQMMEKQRQKEATVKSTPSDGQPKNHWKPKTPLKPLPDPSQREAMGKKPLPKVNNNYPKFTPSKPSASTNYPKTTELPLPPAGGFNRRSPKSNYPPVNLARRSSIDSGNSSDGTFSSDNASGGSLPPSLTRRPLPCPPGRDTPPPIPSSSRPPRPRADSVSSNRSDNDNVYSYPWFLDTTNRNICTKRLNPKHAEDGHFLVRKSGKSADKPYTVTVVFEQEEYFLPIRKVDSGFAIGGCKDHERVHESVGALIMYHKDVGIKLSRKGVSTGVTKLTSWPH